MRRTLAALVPALLLLGALSVGPASAAHAPGQLDYLVGSGFLCGLAPDACPDVAGAPSGATLAMTGSGSLSPHGKWATGGGEWWFYAPDGSLIAEGTWEATGLISFHSYGSGAAQGLPPELWGGRALVAIRFDVPAEGISVPGMLWIDCHLGDRIPGGSIEGIRVLAAPTPLGGLNFNREVSGLTVFVNTDL
jgi:hypothetical protein